MKIRLSYVSNSSSASYVIAYDIEFFGDLKEFFKNAYLGCETSIKSIEEYLKGEVQYWSEKEKQDFEQKIKKCQSQGKEVICVNLDVEFASLFTLLDNINKKNGGDKLEYIIRNDQF